MARRRYLPPDQDLVHVSFKCVGDAFLMRPDSYASFVIATALGAAAAKYGVRVHAFAFLSNHGHLLLGVRGCRLDAFMQLMKARIARALNAARGRDGAFFKQRYRCEPVLSDEAALGIEQYVHQQAVAHDLVERAVEWPGLCSSSISRQPRREAAEFERKRERARTPGVRRTASTPQRGGRTKAAVSPKSPRQSRALARNRGSYAAVIAGRDRVEARWFDDDAWRRAGARQRDRAAFVRTASVPLSPLPQRVGLCEREIGTAREALARSMRNAEAAAARRRKEAGARRLPAPSRYTRQDPGTVPERRGQKRKGPQPMAHGSTEQVRAFVEAYGRVMEAYDCASARYRATGVLCAFPAGTFPPRIPIAREVS
ncbi:MAG: hypothetical protein OHK0013_13880 [Sandaracinaceae bacterium]